MASSSALGKWIGGILATVLSSVLIYYLTVGHSSTPAPPAAPPIEIEGRVIDTSTNSLIVDALVLLKTEKFAGSQKTDSEGRYCFVIDSLPPTTAASFEIEAKGYPRFSINETLQYLSSLEDNRLIRASNDKSPSESANPAAAAEHPAAVASGAPRAAANAKRPTLGALAAKRKPVESPGPVAASAPALVMPLPRYVRRADPVRLGLASKN